MNFKLNKTAIDELVHNIYFIEEIWTEIQDVYELLLLEEVLENETVSRSNLLKLENKLDELKKHYKFYIQKQLDVYKREEVDRIEKYNNYINNIHDEIAGALEKVCQKN